MASHNSWHRNQRQNGQNGRHLVIYVRYSSDMQRPESCMDQERKVRENLARMGIDNSHAVIIRDEAESGQTEHRDGFGPVAASQGGADLPQNQASSTLPSRQIEPGRAGSPGNPGSAGSTQVHNHPDRRRSTLWPRVRSGRTMKLWIGGGFSGLAARSVR